MRDKLTARQEAFSCFYHATRNATQSAISAGYSPHLIDTHSSLLLGNARIKARLAELQAQVKPDPEVINAAINERTKLLLEVARHGIEMPVSAGHKIAAIDLLNKMDRLYSEAPVFNKARHEGQGMRTYSGGGGPF